MHVFGLPMALTILHSYKCDILFVEKAICLKRHSAVVSDIFGLQSL